MALNIYKNSARRIYNEKCEVQNGAWGMYV